MEAGSGRAARRDRLVAPDAVWAVGAVNAIRRVLVTDSWNHRSLHCGSRLSLSSLRCVVSILIICHQRRSFCCFGAYSVCSHSHKHHTRIYFSYSRHHSNSATFTRDRYSPNSLLFCSLSLDLCITLLAVSVTSFSESIQSVLHKFAACWSPDLFTVRCCLRLRANANAVIIL